jgi:hypothetical protein
MDNGRFKSTQIGIAASERVSPHCGREVGLIYPDEAIQECIPGSGFCPDTHNTGLSARLTK